MRDHKNIALYVGVDWADQKHDFHVIHGGKRFSGQVPHKVDDLEGWIAKLQSIAGGKQIAIGIEQKRGSLLNALLKRENVIIYPIDPGKFANYRKSFTKEAKTDQADARLLAQMLRERIDSIDALEEVSPLCQQIHETARMRRGTVDERTRVSLKLQSQIKACFPLIFELFGNVTGNPARQILKRWPTQRLLQKANPRSVRCALSDGGIRDSQQQNEYIERIRSAPIFCRDAAFTEAHDLQVKLLVQQYELMTKTITLYDERLKEVVAKHPDAKLFLGLRGVGPVIAARLLSAFEMEACHCETADQLSARSGISPVPNNSGKNAGQRHLARYACNRYLKQTFHEFVDSARVWCRWTKARYQQLRARKMKHNAVVRKIARSWIRILFRIWQTKEPFDSERYLTGLLTRNPELARFLPT